MNAHHYTLVVPAANVAEANQLAVEIDPNPGADQNFGTRLWLTTDGSSPTHSVADGRCNDEVRAAIEAALPSAPWALAFWGEDSLAQAMAALPATRYVP